MKSRVAFDGRINAPMYAPLPVIITPQHLDVPVVLRLTIGGNYDGAALDRPVPEDDDLFGTDDHSEPSGSPSTRDSHAVSSIEDAERRH